MILGPLLPGVSDTDEALAGLFELAADSHVDRVWTDTLTVRPRVWPAVQAVLRQHAPELHELYRGVLFDPARRASYQQDVDGRVHRAAAAARLEGRRD